MSTTPRLELDLLVEHAGRTLAVELKYPRAALTIELGDEAYDLRLGAPDVESFWVKSDWQPHERHFACLVRLLDSGPSEVYVIPTTVATSPEGLLAAVAPATKGSLPGRPSR
jgi:hypothetical protein